MALRLDFISILGAAFILMAPIIRLYVPAESMRRRRRSYDYADLKR